MATDPSPPAPQLTEPDLLQACPSCGYRLTGLPIDHRCPECGLTVDRRWALIFRCDDRRGWGAPIYSAAILLRSRMGSSPPMQAAGLAVILVLAVVAALAIFHNTGGSPGAAVVVFALVLLVGLFAGYLRYPAGRWRYTVMVGPAGMKIWDRFERRLEQYDWSRIGKVSGGCFRGLILRFGHEQVIFDTGNWASIEDCARRINAYRRRLENAGLIEP